MIERIRIVFAKEVRDNLRDRRTLIAAFSNALFGPLILIALLVIIGRTMTDRADRPLKLPLKGAEHAPGLVAFLEQRNVSIEAAPNNPEAAVRAGDHDVVLVVPETYTTDLQTGRPATVQLITDESQMTSQQSVERTQTLLEAYSAQLGTLRLLARGISPVIVSGLAVEQVDVATPQSRAAIFLNTFSFFLIFSIFIGGMYLAIDTTTGERERGSLEPLLINPVARSELVLGKLAATLLFTLASVVATLIGFGLALNYAPLDLPATLDPSVLLRILLIALPMMLLAAALQLLIATFARSFKDAQNYLGFIIMLPALPGIFLSSLAVKAELWTMLIPTFGQQLLINQLLRGDPVSIFNVLVSTIVTIVLGGLLLLVVIRLYDREQVVFRR